MSLGVGVPFSEPFYTVFTYTRNHYIALLAGHGPGFIAHGKTLHRSSPVTTDDASTRTPFNLASTQTLLISHST